MIFKDNMKLVEEVINSIEGLRLFSKRMLFVDNIVQMNDFVKALSLAYNYDEYEINGEKCYSWQDLRELQISEVRSEVYKKDNYKEYNDELRRIGFKNLNSILTDKIYEQVWDDVYSDLINCARTRAIMGDKNIFFEKILEVYKAGGWPCGWEGNFPEGKLIAYFPL